MQDILNAEPRKRPSARKILKILEQIVYDDLFGFFKMNLVE